MPASVISADQAPRLSPERRPRQSLPRADELGPRAQHLAAKNLLLTLPVVLDNAAMPTELSKADPPKRKRRWFQFSLRTLMIGVALLAVVCAYVAHEASIVAARKASLAVQRLATLSSRQYLQRQLVEGDSGKSPWLLRRLLGDEQQSEIEVSPFISPSELVELAALFPEATITAEWRF